MSTIPSATSTLVKFPSEKSITDYISSHPLKKHAIDVNMYIPDSLPTIAKCFADKQMQRNEIAANARKAIWDAVMEKGSEEQKKIVSLLSAVKNLVTSCETREGKESKFTSGLKKDVLGNAEPQLLAATVMVYELALNDLLDGATYTPPKDSEDQDASWTRHVTQISKQ